MDFGEIVEPVSRAFWENYDDLAENEDYEDPIWIWLTKDAAPEMPSDKSHVVIFEGESVSEFVSTAILQSRSPLCKLRFGNCAVYDLPDTSFLVVVCQEKNLNLFSPITALLEPFIRPASRITTLTTMASARHKRTECEIGPEDDPVCYLRGLNGTLNDVKPLQAPNILTGVAAGVSIWRQFNDLPLANNYIAFIETPQFDSRSTRPMLGLLKKLGVPCVDTYKGLFKTESNLYM